MTKSLFASASVLALGLASTAAHAQLSISTATTTPVKTSTATNGAPGDISITSAGSVKPTSGVAVTIDSNNSVDNQGAIQITGADNSTGIQAVAGVTGKITNSGTITLDESYKRTDTNGDGVLDGPYAQGTTRFGIQTLGTFNGAIASSGAITVSGNNSAGIGLGGTLNGALTSSSTIAVLGDNSYGIRTGAVTGDVAISGAIAVAGTGSSAVLIGGDVGGTVKFNATAQTTGYSTTTLPTSTSSLTASNMLQGGPAVSITGNVAGGVQLLAPTTITNSDNSTTNVPGAAIASYGSAPAVLIGSASNAVTLGAIAGDANGFGLLLGGAETGDGVFANINATAVQLGGLGKAVTVANGIRVTGNIAGLSNGGSATGLYLGAGTSTPTLVNTGQIAASISGTAATGATPAATGVLIASGASLPSLTNSATISAKGITGATARAIYDQSGTLKQITNTGQIGASSGTTNIAIDLTSVTSGASITQSLASSTATAPVIAGAILFGGGSNSLTASSGAVNSDVTFAGSGNSLSLSNAAAYTGNADFVGTAGTLTLAGTSSFSGLIKNGANTAVVVSGGTLAPSIGTSTAASLAMTGGTLRVTIDGTTGTNSLLQVAGNASFAAGTSVAVQFTKLGQVAGNFTFLQAGSLTGANNLTLSTSLPFLFSGSLATNAANTAVAVSIARKTATQLGLTGNAAAIYDPAIVAATADDAIGNVFLGVGSTAALTSTLNQLMPVYETGGFDSASLATRSASSVLAEHALPALQGGSLGAWIQLIGWSDRKGVGATQGYSAYGAGFVVGVEHSLGGLGRVGISGVYGWGVDKQVASTTAANTTHAQVGLYWRGTWGGLHAYASGAYGRLGFDNSRVFDAASRTSTANWNATLYSGTAGLSWQLESGNFYFRPSGSVDYVRLKENGYTEAGGGAGVNLIVDPRTSSESAVNGALAIGFYLRRPVGRDADFLKFEIEGGDRYLLDSKMPSTVARFTGGSSFALAPEARKTGWTAKLRVIGGGDSFSMSGEIGAEKQQDHIAGVARMGIHFAL